MILLTNLVLTIHILSSGVARIDIPPTDPTHLYYMETTTNLVQGFDLNSPDDYLFFGSDSPQFYVEYPPRQQEFFRIEDLGPY
jgi:hypothetical protein